MPSDRDEARQRLFFALWPDAGIRGALDRSAGKLLGKRVKRVAAANLHITLAFAGPVNTTGRNCLEVAAGDIREPCFELCINRTGYWQKPRIFWAGSTHIPAECGSLAGALRHALEGCGIEPDSRPYQPHITLARKVSKAPGSPEFPPLVWSISDFSLVESVTEQAGVRYHVHRSWTLGRA